MIKGLSAAQKILLLLFVSLVSLGVGLGLGKLVTSPRVTSKTPVIDLTESTPSPTETTTENSEAPANWKSYTGLITTAGAGVQMQGTHRLLDENGETMVLLEARDDKLEVATGMTATVRGPVKKTVEGSEQIMTVEEIVFATE